MHATGTKLKVCFINSNFEGIKKKRLSDAEFKLTKMQENRFVLSANKTAIAQHVFQNEVCHG